MSKVEPLTASDFHNSREWIERQPKSDMECLTEDGYWLAFAEMYAAAVSKNLQEELAAMQQKLADAHKEIRRFPIIDGPSVPWEAIAPHDKQAQHNHSQTLNRLAERGGLWPAEAWFVLNDKKWEFRADWKQADEDGKKLISSINERYERRKSRILELEKEIAALRETK